MKKILVALSGGIDSAAAVLLLRRQGWQTEALYLDITGDPRELSNARQTAAALNVDLHVEDVAGAFEDKIINYIISEHAAGRTPSPCAMCNPHIKWLALAEVADRLGIEHIATGHYVRIGCENGIYYINRGVDPSKDQSYYLWALGQPTLRRAVTPLGGYTKTEVREFLAAQGMTTLARSRESMGICFLKGKSYENFLNQNLERYISAGDVVDRNGTRIGTHSGYPLYTVGQKKGFSVDIPSGDADSDLSFANDPFRIISVDPAVNRLTASRNPDDLYSAVLWGAGLKTPDLRRLTASSDLRVVIRGIGRNPEGTCRVIPEKEGLFRVELHGGKAWAAAPGQPMVFYEGERVVGGAFLVTSKGSTDTQ